MPSLSKMKVFTSASAPSAGISLPFQRKVTPAALPILATISWLARTEAWAGAMRVSRLTVWPSAMREIQEVSLARITSFSWAVDFAGGSESGWLETVPSLGAAPLAGLGIDEAAGAEAGARLVPKPLVTGGCCRLGVDAAAVVLLAVEDWAA